MVLRLVLVFYIFLTLQVQAQENGPKYLDTSLDFETRALDLVNQMTLDEKIAQLGDKAPAIPRLRVPKYNWWNECLHGVARAGSATVFPQAIAMAATFDTTMMKRVADAISDEARAKHHEALRKGNRDRYYGLTFWSPNINIFRDPRWGRGHETYGEDPYLTGQMGIQFVKGLQGDHQKYLKLIATAKHFAVHNGPEPSRHWFNVTPNTRDLWETYLPAFEDLMVDAKAYSIMGAYNRVDGESASASWLLLEDILRKQWGFEGFVVSDCGAIRDIHEYHKIVHTPGEAVAIGVRKGCDLNCGNQYQSYLKSAVETGLIDEAEIDLALYRLMLGRMKLGMFDPSDQVPYAQVPYEVNNSKEHDELALQMAQKSMTLLKNDGTLPLNKKKIKKIAIIGANANSVVALRANYFGDATNPVTVLDGIKKAASNDVEITYSQGAPLVIRDNSVVGSEFLSHRDENGNTGPGLIGQYFKNTELTGEPHYQRVDEKVNFNWWHGSPNGKEVRQGIITKAEDIGADSFSARWTGQIKSPGTGEFVFELETTDGVRLFIDNELIIDHWKEENKLSFKTATINLEKGKSYDIKLEYFEGTKRAHLKLKWEIPNHKQKYEAGIKRMLSEVKDSDIAIYVGGLDANWEGEEMPGVKADGFNGGDRTKIELPGIQQKTVRAMIDTGTPVVMVLMSGSALALNGLEDDLKAILMAWYPGQRGGDAVADVLFGNYNPAGRLPVTFYTSTEDLADFKDYNMRAGKGFTYRYFNGEPLYPFGHGLSYSKFQYADLKFDKTRLRDPDKLKVSITVKNTGRLAGEEVVQLYVRDVSPGIWMPIKQLRKFQRIALKKGESKTLEFTLDIREDFRYYNAMQRSYSVEPGEFEIQIGASSQDTRQKGIVIVE